MENYQKMYSTLFNAITDALAQIENQQDYSDGKIHTHRRPAKSRRNVYHSTELK